MIRVGTVQGRRARATGRGLARLSSASRRRFRLLPIFLVGALAAGLGLASLRIDILRLRYALAALVRVEKTLLEEQRELQAHVRALRDPSRLAALARERGFSRPDRVIELSPMDAGAGRLDGLAGSVAGALRP